MGFSTLDENQIPVGVTVDDKMIRVTFSGGLELATPVERFPRLRDAEPSMRANWRLIGRGYGIHWPDVDEDISVRGLFATIRQMPEPAAEQIPALISDLMKTTGRLNALFEGRPFTPDGHLVGSIGEVVAEYIYDLKLEPCNTPQIDAKTAEGKTVQIKLTGEKGSSFGIRWSSETYEGFPDLLLCLKLDQTGFSEVYNGPFPVEMLREKKDQKNGQIRLSASSLKLRNPTPGTIPIRRGFERVNRWFTPELAEVA